MARTMGPRGAHVAYLVIDLERQRKNNPDKPDDYFCHPDDIAGEVWHIAHKPRSVWSFRSEIRPYGEVWWRPCRQRSKTPPTACSSFAPC